MLQMLLLLYMLNDKPMLENKVYPDLDTCKEAVLARIQVLDADPRVKGLFAACLMVPGNKS